MGKLAIIILAGISYGVLSSAGVFTVFAAVGLIPRFAGATHTAKYGRWYEEMVIWGTLVGGGVSIFERYCGVGRFLRSRLPEYMVLWEATGIVCQISYGLFSGMFVGCLALSIAEILDSIPIMSRRIGFRHGIGLAVLAMAIGKLCGSLFYFLEQLQRTMIK